MDGPLPRRSSGADGYHSKLNMPMPRHTLQNFQIARLSTTKQSKPKGKQYANKTTSGTKNEKKMDLQGLSFSHDISQSDLSSKGAKSNQQKNDSGTRNQQIKQSSGGDTPRFKDKLLGAPDKQGGDQQSSSEHQPQNTSYPNQQSI